jgi:UDP-3-O-[3-hydroxymyristoyl] glucosamine N-acyltransferase
MIGIPIAPRPIHELVERHGGALRNMGGSMAASIGAAATVRRLAPVGRAGIGELAPLLDARYVDDARRAVSRGALLLVDEGLATSKREVGEMPGWFHPHAAWALACVLDTADAPATRPAIGDGCAIHESVVVLPRVRIGNRVTIGPGCVIGAPGFGFAAGDGGKTRAVPQLGGVDIDDDVHIGALTTIDAGTLAPTHIRRGVKLDAHVHIGHNCDVGEETVIAAQSGLAGSVVVGRGVKMGGQVGIADHLRIGDGARIAAKSGVIGDVADGATVAGYPAVERHRWLRGLAELYRLAGGRGSSMPPSSDKMHVSGMPGPINTLVPPKGEDLP